VAGPPGGDRVRPEAGVHHRGLDVGHRVLLDPHHRHLHLLGRHRGRVARLLAELALGGLLPAAQREVAEGGQDQGRGEDDPEDEEGEARPGH
jgi:hypothetical protein